MGRQRWDDIADVFTQNAIIYWPNTNEKFNITEFLTVNKNYPGRWDIYIKHIVEAGNTIAAVVQAVNKNEGVSSHAASIAQIQSNKIHTLYEYWGDDIKPPLWRKELKIGTAINRTRG
jgi:hypothetical protein